MEENNFTGHPVFLLPNSAIPIFIENIVFPQDLERIRKPHQCNLCRPQDIMISSTAGTTSATTSISEATTTSSTTTPTTPQTTTTPTTITELTTTIASETIEQRNYAFPQTDNANTSLVNINQELYDTVFPKQVVVKRRYSVILGKNDENIDIAELVLNEN